MNPTIIRLRGMELNELALLPITVFRTRYEPYFHFLRRRVDGIPTNLDKNTILVRKGNFLIGWVNQRNVISPLYNEDSNWAIYNIIREEIAELNFTELQDIGVFENFVGFRPPRFPSPEHRHNQVK